MPAVYSTSWLFNNNKLTHFSVLWSAEVNGITTCIKTKDKILKFSFQYLALKSVAIICQGVMKPAQHIIRLYRVCVISSYFILRLSLKQWAPSVDELTEVVPNDYYILINIFQNCTGCASRIISSYFILRVRLSLW